MSFFKGLFSGQKKSFSEDQRYFNLFTAFQGMKNCTFSQQTCEVPGCGTSFILPSVNGNLLIGDCTGSLASKAYNYVLNVGGYCPECHRLVCHDHIKMVTTQVIDEDAILKQIACKVCGTLLVFSRA